MRKKGLLLAILLLFLFGGCDTASQSEEWVLPTMDPVVEAQKGDASEEKGDTEETVGDKETDEKLPEDEYGAEEAENREEDEKDSASGLMSFVEKSKHAVDQNQADAVEIIVEAACIEAQIKGMEFPKESIRFRYTNELDELSDSYALLKEAIRDLMGDDVIEIKVEGNYLMVEISKGDDGKTEVEVELLHE